jgi:hypothetical protein
MLPTVATTFTLVRVREVGGSNPPAPTNRYRRHQGKIKTLSEMPTVARFSLSPPRSLYNRQQGTIPAGSLVTYFLLLSDYRTDYQNNLEQTEGSTE